MGSMSVWHWLLVIGAGLLLFGGAGKIPRLMGDMAKGIKAFKSGMQEEAQQAATTEPPPAQANQQLNQQAGATPGQPAQGAGSQNPPRAA
jgi:sec-independent protein translocase protein TatA